MQLTSIKKPEEIRLIQTAGQVVAAGLKAFKAAIQPGVLTSDLEFLAQEILRSHRVYSSFKNYRGFPAALCVSVNDEVVHGVPGKRKIQEGDIVSLDFGANYMGYHADAAITVGVGSITDNASRLIQVTRDALMQGIFAAQPGNHVGDIGYAIKNHIESNGLVVIKEFMGHEIGRRLHEALRIPNYGNPGEGVLLEPGMVFTIEPMATFTAGETKVLEDGFTVATVDGYLAAHFEHTITITKDGPQILTEFIL